MKPLKLFDQLLPQQQNAVNAAIEVNGFALLLEQRVGKTWVTGGVIERLQPLEVLIVGLKTNLRSTWEKFIKAKLPEYSIFFTLADYEDHQATFFKAWCLYDRAILLINYEALPSIIKRTRKRKWNLTVYDEAHKLKSRSSRNSRLAKQLVNSSERRLALTGTPINQNPIDMFALMRFVEPSALGLTWKAFEEEYLVPVTLDLSKAKGPVQRRKLLIQYQIKKGKQKFRQEKLEQFYEKLKPYTLRIEKADVGIKSSSMEIIPVRLWGEQSRIYRTMEKDLVVHLEDTTVKASFKVTQIIKAQQITGGFLMDGEGAVNVVGKAKARKLRELLKIIEPPLVIFCKFLPELDIIEGVVREFYQDVARLTGSVKDTNRVKARTKLLKSFQRGAYDVLICQQRTGGAGIDLYAARTAIVYSMGHSFIDFDQMKSRLDFLRQTTQAKFLLLVAKKTVDEDILTAVRSGRSISRITLNRLKRD